MNDYVCVTVLSKPGESGGLNFDGSAEGTVSIAGPALDPTAWKASAQLSKFEIHPIEQPGARGTAPFTLRNTISILPPE